MNNCKITSLEQIQPGSLVCFNHVAPIERLKDLEIKREDSLVVLRVEDDRDTIVHVHESRNGTREVTFPSDITVVVKHRASGRMLAVAWVFLQPFSR